MSPALGKVWVSLNKSDGRLSMMIEDDGAGIPDGFGQPQPGEPGFGILGMQERAEALGGTLRVAIRKGLIEP